MVLVFKIPRYTSGELLINLSLIVFLQHNGIWKLSRTQQIKTCVRRLKRIRSFNSISQSNRAVSGKDSVVFWQQEWLLSCILLKLSPLNILSRQNLVHLDILLLIWYDLHYNEEKTKREIISVTYLIVESPWLSHRNCQTQILCDFHEKNGL